MVEERDEKAEERTKVIIHIERDEEELKTGTTGEDSTSGLLEVEVLPGSGVDKARDERMVKVIIKATDNYGDAYGNETQ